ncbi:type II toxin-antitoxin system RelE/ParE family toxin [Silanimonas sp.]|jgi:toxin ParE1/3/4|uniref:type II toxin-antitoxin system RelE/ParE family toxin n=1 Tax=Silanimonas sp. TaxID=1929290 RepID=UPI0022BCA92C|nr:type II toxin-antitoxin system RelE/ParE family toxin [Silanimonas sp.]MCZ8116421.1 type II toxin-antitoxin system RelE/ParE family toxin [Silanimonas sp.]
MRYRVELTEDAARDLDELHAYVAGHDSPRSAERLLDRILEVVTSLESAPDRGTVPRELRELGIDQFRQVYFKPYRIVYRPFDELVVIYLIVDGRRDLQTLLTGRLLG